MLSETIAAGLDRGVAPMSTQIYRSIRTLILNGALKGSTRLPSSRVLARDLSVGRNTVIHAYEQLIAEGYLESNVGDGSYVSADEQRRFGLIGKRLRSVGDRRPPQSRRVAGSLSRRAAAVIREPDIPLGRAFAACVPELSEFPFATWQRSLRAAWRGAGASDLGYGSPGGESTLREAIAEFVRFTRQVRCSASQVIVVNGAQQGFNLCARLLADPGDRVWVEDPGYPGARRAFRAADLQLVPIGLDEQGMAPKEADWNQPPRLIYVTPSHQFPTGLLMTLNRRRELLSASARAGSWIIEDDYDGEFRLSGKPIASLQGIDDSQRVIYVGTFSKALFPELRLGYLIVPESISERLSLAAARLILQGRIVEQRALATFMLDGHFETHIRRMRLRYTERRQLLAAVWQRELGDAAPLSGAETGMHVVAQLPSGNDEAVSRQARDKGIVALSLASLSLGRPDRSGLLLGYGAADEGEIQRHATNLARIVGRSLRSTG